jgi:hypothetical protein
LRDALIANNLAGLHHVLRVDRSTQGTGARTLKGISAYMYFEIDPNSNAIKCFRTRGVGSGVLMNSEKLASVCNGVVLHGNGSSLEPLPVMHSTAAAGRIFHTAKDRKAISISRLDRAVEQQGERELSGELDAVSRENALVALGFNMPKPIRMCECGTLLYTRQAVDQHKCQRSLPRTIEIKRRPFRGDTRFPASQRLAAQFNEVTAPAVDEAEEAPPYTSVTAHQGSSDDESVAMNGSPRRLRPRSVRAVHATDSDRGEETSGAESDGLYEPSSSSDGESDFSADEVNLSDLSIEMTVLRSDQTSFAEQFPIMQRIEGFATHPGDRDNPEIPDDVRESLISWFNSRESPRAPATHALLVTKFGAFRIWKLRLREQRIKQWQSQFSTALKKRQRTALAAQVTSESASTAASENRDVTATELSGLKGDELKMKFIALGGTAEHLRMAGGKTKSHYISAIGTLIKDHSAMDKKRKAGDAFDATT